MAVCVLQSGYKMRQLAQTIVCLGASLCAANKLAAQEKPSESPVDEPPAFDSAFVSNQDTQQPPQPGQVSPPQNQPNALEKLPDTVSAPPFTVRDKFDYRVVQSFGIRGFAGAFVGAAIGQARNSPHEWGEGVEGFAERYGSGLASNLSRQTF